MPFWPGIIVSLCCCQSPGCAHCSDVAESGIMLVQGCLLRLSLVASCLQKPHLEVVTCNRQIQTGFLDIFKGTI